MWTLIGLGTAAAYLYSVAATLFPQSFPTTFMQDGRIGVYFEAAAVIISLTLLGQILELKARSQTSAAIKSLLGLSPKTARRITPMVRRKTFLLPMFTWETICGSDLVKKCQLMALYSREKVRWMNPCSLVNLCRS